MINLRTLFGQKAEETFTKKANDPALREPGDVLADFRSGEAIAEYGIEEGDDRFGKLAFLVLGEDRKPDYALTHRFRELFEKHLNGQNNGKEPNADAAFHSTPFTYNFGNGTMMARSFQEHYDRMPHINVIAALEAAHHDWLEFFPGSKACVVAGSLLEPEYRAMPEPKQS